jgi:hypothetical protein
VHNSSSPRDRRVGAEGDAERAPLARHRVDADIAHLDRRVRGELSPRDRPELVGWRAVADDEVVDPRRGLVAPRSGVAQEDPLAGPAEGQRRRQPGRPASDDDDVVRVVGLVHRLRVARRDRMR